MAYEDSPFNDFGTQPLGDDEWRIHGSLSRDLAVALTKGKGRVFLLGGELAGSGKTTVLRDALAKVGGFAVLVEPDRRALDGRLTVMATLLDALRHGGEGMCEQFLEGMCRVVGLALASGLRAGKIPAQDPEGWAVAMENSPTMHLRQSREGAALIIWLADPSREGLRGDLARRLVAAGNLQQMNHREAGRWLEFSLAMLSDAKLDALELISAWMEFSDDGFADRSVEFSRQTLEVIGLGGRVICAVDHTDGVMGRDALAREVAGLALDFSNVGASVVVAVNRDAWEAGFLTALPDAWRDRLEAKAEWIGGVSASEARELIDHVLKSSGEPVDDEFAPDVDGWIARCGRKPSARAVLRYAHSQRMLPKPEGGEIEEDFSFVEEEVQPPAFNEVEARVTLFRSVGDRLPFVVSQDGDEFDAQVKRVRWMTADHEVWIGLADPTDGDAWRKLFDAFSTYLSEDRPSAKLVIPIFENGAIETLQGIAEARGIHCGSAAVDWLDTRQLTPAGWWRGMPDRQTAPDEMQEAAELWEAVTRPVPVRS